MISSELIEDLDIENTPKTFFSQEQIDIIKNSIAPNLNENEFKYFIYICLRFNLDPIAKQIYPLKVFDKKSNSERLIPFVSIDGLRLLADRSGKYAPGRPTEFIYSDQGNVISSTCFVKKLVGNEWHEVSAIAVLNEYSTGKWPWTNKPHIMLEKCAEAKAIRKAFPADTSGLYVQEEEGCIKNENISSKAPEKISNEKAKEIETYFLKRPEMKKQLLSFCGVKSFADIKTSQLKACENFVKRLHVAISQKKEEVDCENS